MARLLVIGALAWDIPVRLNRSLASGARIAGVRGPGRLGGGGANAGVALRRAGHEVAIGAFLPDGETSAAIRAAAAGAGLRLDLVRRWDDAAPGTTFVLIEPDGERAILFLRDDGAAPAMRDAGASDDWRAFGAAGLYVRSAYPGAAETAEQVRGPVIAHWPLHIDGLDADVAIGSHDDLGAMANPYRAARERFGPRLAWAIVTAGAAGATAYGRSGAIVRQPALAARVLDTTGAGDVFAAGVLDGLVAGADIAAALAHAARWAQIAVEVAGSAPIDAPDGAFAGFAAQAS